MSLNNAYLTGDKIVLEPQSSGNVVVNATADKEQRVNDTLVTTHRETSFDIHKPTNIEGNTHITGNLTVTGGLTSATPAIDNNRVLINTDPNVIADSTILPVKDIRTNPVSGWYVLNSGGDKFNFYYYGKTNLPEVHTFDELKYLYCLAEIIQGGNVYFSVYTVRQNDGNDAGSWYRSRHNYIINGTGSTTETGIRLLYVNLGEQPSDIFDSVGRIECTKEAFSSVGPQLGSEEILTISVQSDSSAAAGQVEYILQNVGFKLEHVIQNFMHITDGTGFTEAEIRSFIESYGYQDEAMVNALIAAAVSDFETSAEIDARGYLTEPEILALLPANQHLEGVLSSNVSVNGQDDAWYLNNANGIVASGATANWDGSVFTVPVEGNYQVSMGLVADNAADEFKCYLDVLDSGSNIEKKYVMDHSAGNVGRMSSVSLPTLALGKKLRIGVYNPQALGQTIKGTSTSADSFSEDFEGFAVAPISNSAGMSIQGGWSGGAQAYFQNDSTDDETIVNTLSVVPGSQSWFTGNVQLYGNPGQGSPHTPKLLIESTAPDEATFNTNLQGKTYNASFYFYSPSANDGDGSTLKVYNGVYQGNDRTGFNLNIKKAPAALTVTTFTFTAPSTFNEVTLETNLAYDSWHKVDIQIVYDAGGDPNGDIFTYKFTGVGSTGTTHNAQSWPNTWRLANSFDPVYGTQLAFGETAHVSGWFIDNIAYNIESAPEVNTHFSISKIN